jgi:predicted molibdopterin-dependent oxidoreductase YjgC
VIAGIASLMGTKYKYNTAEDVFNELAATVEAYRGMTYRKIGSRGLPVRVPRTAAARV